jgi:putative membrane protein
VVTAVVGLAFVAAWATGRSSLFVRPWFAPALLVAGAVLAAVAWRGSHELSKAAALVMLLPVLAGAALTPSVAGRIPPGPGGGAVGARIGDASRLLTGAAGGRVTLLDIAIAEQRVGAAFLDGREVEVDGRVDGNRIARLVMVCCAADARPVTVPVIGRLPADGTWVRVSGTLRATGGRLAVDATSVTGIPTPEEPFL